MYLASKGIALYAVLLYTFAGLGLILFILPGLFVLAIGLPLGYYILKLFVRGYLNVTIRCLNWLRTKYWLAQDDVYLNNLFADCDVAP